MVYVATLRGQRLWRVPLRGEDTGPPQAFLVNQFGRLRTVKAVPGSDALWLSTTNCDQSGGQPPGADRLFRVDLH